MKAKTKQQKWHMIWFAIELNAKRNALSVSASYVYTTSRFVASSSDHTYASSDEWIGRCTLCVCFGDECRLKLHTCYFIVPPMNANNSKQRCSDNRNRIITLADYACMLCVCVACRCCCCCTHSALINVETIKS